MDYEELKQREEDNFFDYIEYSKTKEQYSTTEEASTDE